MNEPLSYTAVEGGPWITWGEGPVDGRSLKKRDRSAVKISGLQVHSLKMADGNEWDCINGWRPKFALEGADMAARDRAMIEAEARDGLGSAIDAGHLAALTNRFAIEGADVPQINGNTSRQPEDLIALAVVDLPPADDRYARAQAYAMRNWACQSVDVTRGVRIARCIAALEGQGLPTDGVVYPEIA